MALRGLDSGEATRFPTYQSLSYPSWTKVPNQPSKWQVKTSTLPDSWAGIVTAGQYTGASCFRMLSAQGRCAAMRRTFDATLTESYISFMVKFDTFTTNDFLWLTDNAGTPAISIALTILPSGQIQVWAASTLKATITTGWAPNEWHQVRIHQKTTTNTLEVRIDEAAPVNCSGTAMVPWYWLVIGNPNNVSPSPQNILVDCIQVNDTTGSVNNSWPGTPRIPTATRPTADDGAATDWVRSSGSNDFDMIKEVPPDLDTTYVHSETFGDKSLYSFGALGEPANTVIDAVVLTIVAKRADAAKIIPVIYRGGTTVELTAVAVGADYMNPIEVTLETDPIIGGGAAWTQANLDATEFGFKHAAP